MGVTSKSLSIRGQKVKNWKLMGGGGEVKK